MPGPLLVVDAPFLLYRSFFALPDSIRGADGHPVNALLGATNTAAADRRRRLAARRRRLLRRRAGALPRRAVRRLPRPASADARGARPPVGAGARRCSARFGWYVEDAAELEADDLLGAHAELEAAAGGDTLLLTGDRDMYQCVTERTHVLYLKQGTSGFETRRSGRGRAPLRDPAGVVPDFIALRGDPSDGLPGAPGIGEKTAAELLRRHGTLEQLLAAVADEAPASGRARVHAARARRRAARLP